MRPARSRSRRRPWRRGVGWPDEASAAPGAPVYGGHGVARPPGRSRAASTTDRSLLDHSVGANENGRWHRQAELARRAHVERQEDAVDLLDRNGVGVAALDDLVDE